MLKIYGENVATSEIEAVIAAVPSVKEVVIAPKNHLILDEVPVVFIIPGSDYADHILNAARNIGKGIQSRLARDPSELGDG